jgi:hypothetical protein
MEWPTPPEQEERFGGVNLKQLLLQRTNYVKSVFVDEGKVETRRLSPGGFAKGIPPEESAISALTAVASGNIFGGTGGRRAHLFFYSPLPDADLVTDVGVVAENARITALAAHPDGRIFGATSAQDGSSGSVFVYTPCEYLFEAAIASCDPSEARKIMDTPPRDSVTAFVDDPCHACGKIETLAVPVEGEGVESLVLCKENTLLCGLSSKRGILFTCDLATGAVALKGQADEVWDYSPVLVTGTDGHVYGAKSEGRIFRYNTESEKIEDTGLQAPSLKGRQLYNKVEVWAKDEFSKVLYGGTSDGLLFIFDPANMKVTTLGKPVKEDHIKALTVGNDGRVYGIGGEENGCAHLFCYNPETGDMRDLGVPMACVDEHWYGYRFSAAVTGKWGEIYLGESDRISHLFIYFPPINARK